MTNKDDRFSSGGDIAGTLVFAIEGAVAAVHGNLDLMGLMVLAFATALGGGIIRDLLIGDVPPASLRDWRYGATAFAGAAIVFFLHRPVERHDRRNCDPGCGGFVAVRDGEDPEGACVSNASAGGSAPGNVYGSGRGNGARCLVGAGSHGVEVGCVCDGGTSGGDPDDGGVSRWSAANVGGDKWRSPLF